jgi:hypothetical protein
MSAPRRLEDEDFAEVDDLRPWPAQTSTDRPRQRRTLVQRPIGFDVRPQETTRRDEC